jgi:type II secretory pathway component PulC
MGSILDHLLRYHAQSPIVFVMKTIWNMIGILATSVTTHALGDPIVTDGSELGIQLMGAIVQKQSSENVALLKVYGAVKAVKPGHPLTGRYHVVAISQEYVEISEDSKIVYRIQQDKFAAQAGKKLHPNQPTAAADLQVPEDIYKEDGFERQKDRIKMTGMYRDKLVKEDLARVLMQATVEPVMENGQIGGFKISQIDAGSIYDKAGLLNGDVITQINDQELTSVAMSIKLLQSLKSANHMEVNVRRNGQSMRLTVDVH